MTEEQTDPNTSPQELLDKFANKFENDPLIEVKKQVVQSLADICELSQNTESPSSELEPRFTEFMAAASPPEEERTDINLTDEQMTYLDPVIEAMAHHLYPDEEEFDRIWNIWKNDGP